MKKALYLIIHLAVVSLTGVATAATVELMPDIGSMTGQGYNSNGRLSGGSITGDDVKNWLGSRSDGWYTTTGNGDMRWGNATSTPEDQTINLPSMNGTAGVCFGLKMTIENIQDYSGLSFSMNLTPSGTTGTYTYSVWYETNDGEMVELCKETRNNNGTSWNVHYDLTEDQLKAMKENGNGKVYAVVGSTGGNGGDNATIEDFSLEGTLAVPEPAAASLGLLGLAGLMLRRRRVRS